MWLVLSLWKLRVGVEAYYLAQVADGLEEYYTGLGEAAGVWTGNAAGALGLTGRVAGPDLQAILAGLAPGTALTPNGEEQRPRKGRVPGFDLTFSVPKSVSVLYAVGDPSVQAAVIDAGERAVAEALVWLEREACFVRRGSNDQSRRPADGGPWGTRRMITSGFVAARFRHRTSRLGDPQVHWHVLVANLARGIDGRWTALDGTAMYASKRAAGVLFQTVLRAELSRSLGVEWGPMRSDVAEIAGVPRAVLRLFSKRRVQIEEWLDEHGRSGPVAAQEATLATRPPKTLTDEVALDQEWKDQATGIGWGPDQLEQFLASLTPTSSDGDGEPLERWVVPATAELPERVVGFEEWLALLLDGRLTATDSTFTRHDLTQAVATALPTGVSIARIDQVVNRALATG